MLLGDKIKIECEYKEIVKITKLKPHPKNRNKHPEEQIARLAQLMVHHGMRHPIIVSKNTGYVVAGHGRVMALDKLGIKEAPVDYQEFKDADAEYAFLTADNAIALWAELDFANINNDLGDLGPDFDIDMLGIKDFKLDVAEVDFPELDSGDKPELEQITFTLHNTQAEIVKEAVEKALGMGSFDEAVNGNKNGNAITRVCEVFLQHTAQNG